MNRDWQKNQLVREKNATIKEKLNAAFGKLAGIGLALDDVEMFAKGTKRFVEHLQFHVMDLHKDLTEVEGMKRTADAWEVRRMFICSILDEMLDAKRTAESMSQSLNTMGLVTKTGKQWTKDSLAFFLGNRKANVEKSGKGNRSLSRALAGKDRTDEKDPYEV